MSLANVVTCQCMTVWLGMVMNFVFIKCINCVEQANTHGMFSVSVLPLNPINQFFHLYSFVDLSFLWPSQGKLFDHLITNLVVGSKQGKDRICILAGSAGERLPEFCQSLLYLLCLQNRVATTFPDCRVYRSGNFNYRILWPSSAECLRLGGAGLVDDNQCSKLTPNVNIWTVWIDPFGHPERSLYDFPRSFVQIPSIPVIQFLRKQLYFKSQVCG